MPLDGIMHICASMLLQAAHTACKLERCKLTGCRANSSITSCRQAAQTHAVKHFSTNRHAGKMAKGAVHLKLVLSYPV